MTKTCKENESKLEAVGKEMQAFKLTIAQVKMINLFQFIFLPIYIWFAMIYNIPTLQ